MNKSQKANKKKQGIELEKIIVHTEMAPQLISGIIGTFTPSGMFQFSLFFDRVSYPSLNENGEQTTPGVARDVYASYIVPPETCKNLGQWFISMHENHERDKAEDEDE